MKVVSNKIRTPLTKEAIQKLTNYNYNYNIQTIIIADISEQMWFNY